jgi:hypothetical protein
MWSEDDGAMRRPRLPHAAAAALFAVGSAQGADAVTFLRMVRDYGPRVEANPVAARLVASGDLGLLVAAKIAVVAIVALVVLVAVRRRPITAGVVVTLGVVAGFIGAFSNVIVLTEPVRRVVGGP